MRSTASTDGAAGRRATERLDADERGVARAACLLASGGLAAFPTETVYGLGADGRDAAAVAALYESKGRPRFNPLIAHVASTAEAYREGRFDPHATALAAAFWPGPLTLVVPLAEHGIVCDLARAGLDSVGLRVPSHPVALALLGRCRFPVVAPSANLSGRISPTSADDVAADLAGRIDAILDGGQTPVGVESTIVACLGGTPRLLRPGGVAREAIEQVLGFQLEQESEGASGERPIAPGALASHYAPRARVRLDADTVVAGEASLLFGSTPGDSGRAVSTLNLSPSGDLAEAAMNLFGYLRRLDATGALTIAVTRIPEHGLGEAINDRLRRAAAER